MCDMVEYASMRLIFVWAMAAILPIDHRHYRQNDQHALPVRHHRAQTFRPVNA